MSVREEEHSPPNIRFFDGWQAFLGNIEIGARDSTIRTPNPPCTAASYQGRTPKIVHLEEDFMGGDDDLTMTPVADRVDGATPGVDILDVECLEQDLIQKQIQRAQERELRIKDKEETKSVPQKAAKSDVFEFDTKSDLGDDESPLGVPKMFEDFSELRDFMTQTISVLQRQSYAKAPGRRAANRIASVLNRKKPPRPLTGDDVRSFLEGDKEVLKMQSKHKAPKKELKSRAAKDRAKEEARVREGKAKAARAAQRTARTRRKEPRAFDDPTEGEIKRNEFRHEKEKKKLLKIREKVDRVCPEIKEEDLVEVDHCDTPFKVRVPRISPEERARRLEVRKKLEERLLRKAEKKKAKKERRIERKKAEKDAVKPEAYEHFIGPSELSFRTVYDFMHPFIGGIGSKEHVQMVIDMMNFLYQLYRSRNAVDGASAVYSYVRLLGLDVSLLTGSIEDFLSKIPKQRYTPGLRPEADEKELDDEPAFNVEEELGKPFSFGNVTATVRDYFMSFVNSELLSNIRKFLLSLVSLKWFNSDVGGTIEKYLGKAPKASMLQLAQLLVQSLAELIRIGSAICQGSQSISDVLFARDPILAARQKNTYLMAHYPDALYYGLPVENRIHGKVFISEATQLLSDVDQILKSLAKFDSRRSGVLEMQSQIQKALSTVKQKVSQERPMPYGLILYGPPGIGKSLILEFFYKLWCALKGVKYEKGMVFNMTPSSEYFDGLDPFSQFIWHAGEVGNESDAVLKSGMPQTLIEMNRIMDTSPYALNMAKVGDKGEVYASPEFVVIDTNNKDLHISKVMKCPAAMKRRFVVCEMNVLPEFCKPGSTALDSAKSFGAGDDILNRYEFTLSKFEPQGDKAIEHVLKKTSRVEEMASSLFQDMREFAQRQEKAQTAMSGENSHADRVVRTIIEQMSPKEKTPIKDTLDDITDLKQDDDGNFVLPEMMPYSWLKKAQAKQFTEDSRKRRNSSPPAPVSPQPRALQPVDEFRWSPQWISEVSRQGLAFIALSVVLWAMDGRPDALSVGEGILGSIVCLLGYNVSPFWASLCSSAVALLTFKGFLTKRLSWMSFLARSKTRAERDERKRKYHECFAIEHREHLFLTSQSTRVYAALTALSAGLALAATVHAARYLVRKRKKERSLLPEEGDGSIEFMKPFERDWAATNTIDRFKVKFGNATTSWMEPIRSSPPTFTGDPLELWKSVARNIRKIDVISGDRASGGYMFGVTSSFALVSKHYFKSDNVTLRVYNNRIGPSGYNDIPIVSNDYLDLQDDMVLVNVRTMQFSDVTKHFVDGPLNPVGTVVVFAQTLQGMYTASPTEYDSERGLSISRAIEYKYDNHGPGMCGIPVIYSHGKGAIVAGVHCAGGLGPRSISTVLSRVTLLQAVEKLSDVCSERGLMTVAPESLDLVLEKPVPKSPVRHELFTNHLEYLGKLPGPAMVPKHGSRLVKWAHSAHLETFFKGHFSHERQTIYAKPMLKSVYSPQFISPVNKALRKMDRSAVSLNTDLCTITTNILQSHLIRRLEKAGVKALAPLDFASAVNGINSDPLFRRVNVTTAGGHGFPGSKSKYLPVYSDTDGNLIRGADEELQKAIADIVARVERGESIHSINVAALKDEPRPLEKAKEGSTRLFMVGSLPILILCRMMLGPLYSTLTDLREDVPAEVGINMHRDASQIFDRLASFSEEHIEGDYSNYDQTMPIEVSLAVGQIQLNILKHFGYNDAALKMVRALLCDATYPLISVYKDLFFCPGYQTSGKYGTAEENSEKNAWMLIYCWVYHFIVEKGLPLGELPDFFEFVDISTFGDDVLGAVKSVMVREFNNVSLQRLMKEALGMDFTNSEKTTEMKETLSRDEVSFLKRKPRRDHPIGFTVAPLHLDSMYKMVEWRMPSKAVNIETQLESTLISFLWEAFFHMSGEREFQRMRSDLIAFTKETHGDLIDFARLPTWSDLFSRFSA
jgi:hypothetical protein